MLKINIHWWCERDEKHFIIEINNYFLFSKMFVVCKSNVRNTFWPQELLSSYTSSQVSDTCYWQYQNTSTLSFKV